MNQEQANDHANALYGNGFLHIRNILSKNDVVHARDHIDSLFEKYSDLPDRYRVVHQSGNNKDGYIREINHIMKLQTILASANIAKQCQAIAKAISGKRTYLSFDHAIYKQPCSGSVLWHQDQAYKARVKRMQSLHFWVPLHNISSNGGGMQYVENSHGEKIFPHHNFHSVHTLSVDDKYIDKDNIVKPQVNIGDVIIHLPTTLHSSLPNLSDNTRKAWILHFSPYGRFEPLLPQNLLHYFFKRCNS